MEPILSSARFEAIPSNESDMLLKHIKTPGCTIKQITFQNYDLERQFYGAYRRISEGSPSGTREKIHHTVDKRMIVGIRLLKIDLEPVVISTWGNNRFFKLNAQDVLAGFTNIVPIGDFKLDRVSMTRPSGDEGSVDIDECLTRENYDPRDALYSLDVEFKDSVCKFMLMYPMGYANENPDEAIELSMTQISKDQEKWPIIDEVMQISPTVYVPVLVLFDPDLPTIDEVMGPLSELQNRHLTTTGAVMTGNCKQAVLDLINTNDPVSAIAIECLILHSKFDDVIEQECGFSPLNLKRWARANIKGPVENFNRVDLYKVVKEGGQPEDVTEVDTKWQWYLKTASCGYTRWSGTVDVVVWNMYKTITINDMEVVKNKADSTIYRCKLMDVTDGDAVTVTIDLELSFGEFGIPEIRVPHLLVSKPDDCSTEIRDPECSVYYQCVTYLFQYSEIEPPQLVEETPMSDDYTADLGVVAMKLITTDKTATTIMEELEIKDVSRFYNEFKEMFGCTPTEYRRDELAAKQIHRQQARLNEEPWDFTVTVAPATLPTNPQPRYVGPGHEYNRPLSGYFEIPVTVNETFEYVVAIDTKKGVCPYAEAKELIRSEHRELLNDRVLETLMPYFHGRLDLAYANLNARLDATPGYPRPPRYTVGNSVQWHGQGPDMNRPPGGHPSWGPSK